MDTRVSQGTFSSKGRRESHVMLAESSKEDLLNYITGSPEAGRLPGWSTEAR